MINVFYGGKGYEEAGENRNYLASRMTDEVGEIIRDEGYIHSGGNEKNWQFHSIHIMTREG